MRICGFILAYGSLVGLLVSSHMLRLNADSGLDVEDPEEALDDFRRIHGHQVSRVVCLLFSTYFWDQHLRSRYLVPDGMLFRHAWIVHSLVVL
jgi:hypothetical protein